MNEYVCVCVFVCVCVCVVCVCVCVYKCVWVCESKRERGRIFFCPFSLNMDKKRFSAFFVDRVFVARGCEDEARRTQQRQQRRFERRVITH